MLFRKHSSRPVKITYLHQYFASPNEPAGTRSWTFARALASAGYDVTVVSSGALLPRGRERRRLKQSLLQSGVRLLILPVPYRQKYAFAARYLSFLSFALLSALITLFRRSDLIYATSTPLTIAIPALFSLRLKKTPFILEVRDVWPEVAIRAGALSLPVLQRAARWLEITAYRRAREVVCLSPDMMASVQERNFSETRLSVVTNFADADNFTRDYAPTPSRQERTVMYIGTFGRVNDPAYLIHCAARAKREGFPLKVVLIGEGSDRESLFLLRKELGVMAEVEIRPPIPKREVPLLLTRADAVACFFRPDSGMEANSANKFFDALAAGRPVLINYGGWQKALLTLHEAGVSLPNDPVSGWPVLRSLLNDSEKCEHMGRRAKSLFLTTYNSRAASDALLNIVERQLPPMNLGSDTETMRLG